MPVKAIGAPCPEKLPVSPPAGRRPEGDEGGSWSGTAGDERESGRVQDRGGAPEGNREGIQDPKSGAGGAYPGQSGVQGDVFPNQLTSLLI